MKHLRNLHPAWIAAFIGVAVVLWLASGMLAGNDTAETKRAPQSKQSKEAVAVKVKVRQSHARPVTREAKVSGRTAPVRSVTVRAETSGRVVKVAAQRGASITQGEIIVRLEQGDRLARLRQTKSLREQRRLQFQAAERLAEKGYQTKLDVAQAKANLEAAEAEVDQIQQDLNHTVIRAPFSGVLETRPVEDGDFVSVGDEIGRVIDQNTFIVAGHVSEDVIGYLEHGQPGAADLVDGTTKYGKLRYIASDADPQTLTYLVELEVPNSAGRFISGASADMRLPLEEVPAHEVEPAILTLNEHGDFGINTVGDNNRVRFKKADIVRNRDGKVWLAGLGENARIITVGQGFVTEGDRVEITSENEDVATGGGALDRGQSSATSEQNPQ